MSKPFARILITIALLFTLLAGCASAASPSKTADREAPAAEPAQPQAPREAAGGDFSSGQTAGNDQAIERIVLKNATLSIVVADPAQSVSVISQMAEEMGGYVVSADVYETELESGVRVPRASVKIRVPAERLNEALDRIKQQTDRPVQSENISSQDVTSEYTDLQSRLRNLEAAEAQLTNIMDRATKTEEVLSVYNQLVSVREQIEVIKGQIKYYEQSAALSSISIELVPNAAVQPLTVGGWQPVGVARDAVQALINGLKVIANLAIWTVIFILPTLAILYVIFVLPLTLIVRAIRRRRAGRTPPAPPAQPTTIPPAAS